MSSQNTNSGSDNDDNNNSPDSTKHKSKSHQRAFRRQMATAQQNTEQERRKLPRLVFDPDSSIVCYWTAAVAISTLYNAWMIALKIAFPEMRREDNQSYLPYLDMLSDVIYLLDIIMQLRTAYLQDGIPVFEPIEIRHHYLSQTYFIQDVISVLPSQTILSLLPDSFGYYKYFLCTAGGARLTRLLKFHIIFKFYDIAESLTSNPHLIRVLRLFFNLGIIIHWIACLYYLLSEYEGLGSNSWVYSNDTSQQRFSRKYIICLYWSAMTLTTIGDTNSPETDLEYIFTGLIFMTGVFVFATVMGNVGDVISSMNANRQEFQARMDHIQMYLTHKKVPASLQIKIKKWAEYTWSRTKATDESRLLNMLPERLRAEVAVHVHLDSLKKVKIFEQCETGFLCELVLKLRSQVYSPGDYVCRVGETGREMFIINHGKVEVIVNNPATNQPMVVAVLTAGNYFGEISLLRLDGVQNSTFFNRRTADVRSIGYSELLCLSRRDLMTAFVEYPEAKYVLEDQAKKRMKTNLQAQRQFSVDALMRNSQEHSSVDSGIATKEEGKGQDVSEIKAMIEDLKNANKVPGRTIWQLIARCEVLQAKLYDKEKEIEDSKHRIKDLERLLFSNKYPEFEVEEAACESTNGIDPNTEKYLKAGNKVTKQFSQDEGRRAADSDVKITPEVKISKPEMDNNNENTMNTSRLTKSPKAKSLYQRASSITQKSNQSLDIPSESSIGGYKLFSENIWNFDPSTDYNFTNETSILLNGSDHQLLSLSSTFKDELYLTDHFGHFKAIPEETEEDTTDVLLAVPKIQRAKSETDAVAVESNAKILQRMNSAPSTVVEDEIDFRRLGSTLRQKYDDDSDSRRNSWALDSDEDSDESRDDVDSC